MADGRGRSGRILARHIGGAGGGGDGRVVAAHVERDFVRRVERREHDGVGAGLEAEEVEEEPAEVEREVPIFFLFRSKKAGAMPTANAEGLDRRDASLGTFRSTRVLGVRRRHAPRD